VKAVPLTQGKEALVDDEDYEVLSRSNWLYHQGFAKRWRDEKLELMHVLLVGRKLKHADGNKLNNCRSNLVEGKEARCDKGSMRAPYKTKSKWASGCKGVTWNKNTGMWRVQINGKYHGEFENLRYASSLAQKLMK
jgi:hypothetical protein